MALACQSSCCEDEADVELCPVVSCQIDCDEGAKPGLDIGEKKGEPIETAHARTRRRSICSRQRLLGDCRRQTKALGLAVEPTAVNC